MSDFKKVIKTAIENGFPLDTCGTDERHYSWGLYTDLCGMTVEEAKEAENGFENGGGGGGGGEDTKKRNTITFAMQSNSSGKYVLVLTSTYEPKAAVNISFTIDGNVESVTFPAGQKSLTTDISGQNPNYPYAEISSIAISSEDESYTYSSKNNVSNGVFQLTIVQDGVQSTRNVRCGETVILDSPEEREGYNFVWRTQNGAVIENNTFVMTDGDTRVNGTYEAISYTLYYYIDEEYFDGDELLTRLYSQREVSVKYGTTLFNVLPRTTRQGYDALQWKNGNTVITSATTMPAANITAESTYHLSEYTLAFLVDGQNYDSRRLKYTQPVNIQSGSEDINIFYGSVLESEVPQFNDFASLDTLTCGFGQGTELSFIVPYSPDYEEAAEELDEDEWEEWLSAHMYDYYIAIPANASVTSVTFENAAGIDITDTMNVLNERVTYDGEDYIVYYRQNQPQLATDSNPSLLTTTISGTSSTQGLVDPVKEGYNFTGWEPAIPETMPNHNVNCAAQFEIKQMTIVYKVDGETYSSVTYNYGSNITAIVNPQKEGHTFTGWDRQIPAKATEGTLTVNAEFSINTYSITYIVDTATTVVNYEYNSEVTPFEAPSKVGYTFNGWNAEEPNVMPARNIELTAQFTAIDYTLTYYSEQGVVYSSKTYHYEDTIVAIAAPQKTGYTFTTWSPEVPAKMPNRNLEVTAQYEINKWTFAYLNENGNQISAFTVNYNAPIPSISSPEKVGSTFSGWQPSLPAAMPDSNFQVTAQFSVNRHTITWKVDGVTKYTDAYDYGETITPRANETREGYTFSGWDTEVPLIMDDRDYVVNGAFTINQYTISFILDGEPYSSITANYGAPITAPTPVLTGRTFDGWVTEVPATMPAQNMTIRGTSHLNSYNATYKVNNEIYTSRTFNYGEQIVYPQAEVSGVTVEWDIQYQTMPDHDIVINGLATPKYIATYVIDGSVYTAVSYSVGARIEYPDVPNPGYKLIWTKIYTTMPNSNITINGTYEVETTTVKVYCDAVLATAVTSFDAYSSLTEYECVLGQEKNLTITVPAFDGDYSEIEEEYTDEEFAQWKAEHTYDYYILVPDDSALTYSFENAAGSIIDNTVLPVDNTTVTIDGKVYRKLHKTYDSQTDEVQTGTIKIIVTNNE